MELARIEKVEQLFFNDMLSTLDATGITAEESAVVRSTTTVGAGVSSRPPCS
jgi:hypothetical protein